MTNTALFGKMTPNDLNSFKMFMQGGETSLSSGYQTAVHTLGFKLCILDTTTQMTLDQFKSLWK